MSWPTKKISELCDVVRGSSPRPKGDSRYYGGTIPRLMVSDITRDGRLVTPKTDYLTVEGAKLSRPIKAGTTVMVVSGNVGVISRLKVDACIHDGFVAFKNLNEKIIIPEFFEYYLENIKWTHAKRKVGAIFQNLTTTQIKEINIPVPPLNEQKHIVAVLERAEKLKRKRKHSNEEQKKLIQSIFIEMFGTLIKKPEKMLSLDSVCKKITDGSHNTPKILSAGYPFLTVANMGENIFSYNECKRVSKSDYEKLVKNDCKPLKYDILFSKDGTVGKVMEITEEKEEVVLSSIAILRPNRDLILPTFLAEYLKMDYALNQAISKKSGSAIRRIVLRAIKTIKIPVPSINEQKNFVEKARACYSLRKNQIESKQEIDLLFDALMQKSFSMGD